jgi:hypothetical protein
MFNINGLFDQPFQRTQIFNTSSSTINQSNSNMNTSFDSKLNNNEFSIPYMLPKRVQNMSSSSQTKYTIDSLLDEPLPFSTHLRVSNFNSIHKPENGTYDNGKDPQVTYEL